MEGKKSKRRKTTSSKNCHGRQEPKEKPKSSEVMDDKEMCDRLEVANVLSSLMFLPPKCSDGEDTLIKKSGITTENSTAQLTYITTPSGIPVSLTNHLPIASIEGKQPLIKGRSNFGVGQESSNKQTSAILANLQNKIAVSILTLKRSPNPQSQDVITNHLQQNNTVRSSVSCSNVISVASTAIKTEPVMLPLTLVTTSINHNVATALRNVVSSNIKINTSAIEKASTAATTSSSSHFISSIPMLHSDSDMLPPRQKKEHLENNLPLKKRRVLPVNETSDGISNSITMSSLLYYKNLEESFECSNNINNILPMPPKCTARSIQEVTTSAINETSLHQVAMLPGALFQLMGPWYANARCPYELVLAEAMLRIFGSDDERNSLDDESFQQAQFDSRTSNQQAQFDPCTTYQPAPFNPCTSLMILSDVKLALTPDDDGDLPIHIAVVHQNTELVKRFIDIMTMSGKTVDRFNKLQQTPLHLAVLVNKPDIIMALLSAGANPNFVDRNGCTSVHTAICKQFLECRNAVLKYTRLPCNLNTRDYEGYPTLHKCVELNDLDSMKFLVQNGAAINIQDGKAGRSVLLYATEYKRTHMVEFLLENHVNVELQNYAGVSALLTAQAEELDDILQLLYKALNIGKPNEEPILPSTKKLPIPRIPSNSQLMSNELCSNSRSDSLSQHSTSPIDLSVHRNTESPSPSKEVNSHNRKETRNGKGRGKHGKEKTSTPSIVKEKHASVIAALESRNVNSSGNVYKIDHVNKTQPASNSSMRTLITDELRKKLKTGDQGEEMKYVKNEPDGDVSQNFKLKDCDVNEQDQMKVQILGSLISASLLEESDSNNSNHIYFASMNENCVDKMQIQNSSGYDEESVENITNDNADMDSVDSPVLPRATSLTDETENNETDYTTNNQILSSDNNSEIFELKEMLSKRATSMIVNLKLSSLKSNANDVHESTHDNNVINRIKQTFEEKTSKLKEPLTGISERSPGCSSSAAFLNSGGFECTEEKTEMEQNYVPSYAHSDESLEVDMSDVTKLNEDANKNETDRAHVTNRGSKKTISMDFDDADDDQGLVIDESGAKEDIECEKLYLSNLKGNKNMIDNKLNTVELWLSEKSDKASYHDDEEDNSEELKQYQEEFVASVAHSQTETDEISTAISSIKTKMSLSENESRLESNCNMRNVKDVENSSEHYKNNGVYSQNSISKLSEPILLNCNDNNLLRIKHENEKIVLNDTEQSVVHSNKLLQKPDLNPYTDNSQNTSSVQEHLKTTVKSHTLYFHDGDDYKPIQIFIDDSVQSSLVLQKMLLASRLSNMQNQTEHKESISMETAVKQHVTSHDMQLDKSVSESNVKNLNHGLVTSTTNIYDINSQKSINNAPTINTTCHNSVTDSMAVKQIESFQNAFNDTVMKHGQLLTKSKNKNPLLSSVPSVLKVDLKHVKHYLNSEKMKTTENLTDINMPSFISNHGDIKSCPSKSDFLSKTCTSSINQASKRMPTSFVKTLVTFNGKSACPEGTLTRVNPDVRSKLSKALLSSQRKVALN